MCGSIRLAYTSGLPLFIKAIDADTSEQPRLSQITCTLPTILSLDNSLIRLHNMRELFLDIDRQFSGALRCCEDGMYDKGGSDPSTESSKERFRASVGERVNKDRMIIISPLSGNTPVDSVLEADGEIERGGPEPPHEEGKERDIFWHNGLF